MSSSAIQQISFESIRKPGQVFELASFAAVHVFEGVIAPLVDGLHDRHAWEARPTLESELSDGRSLGRVDGISLTAIEEPYGHLLEVRPPGWRTLTADNERAAKRREGLLGFDFSATRLSDDAENEIVLSALVWYAPMPRSHSGMKVYDPNGRGLLRLVGVDEEFTVVKPSSKAIPNSTVDPSSRGLHSFSTRPTRKPAA